MSLIAPISIMFLLALLLAAPYVLYPILVRRLRSRDVTAAAGDDARQAPRVSILVPACNEAEHIAAKIEGALAMADGGIPVEVLVCSDGSTDGTDEIVRGYADRGVRLLVNGIRLGKPATLNRLVAEASGDLLLMTDASATLSPGALDVLVGAMVDPRVGLASPRYAVVGVNPTAGAEVAYWDAEQRLRQAEAERDLLIGVAGAAYLVRRSLVSVLPEDTINDDFVIPLRVRLAGYRIAFCPDAVAWDAPTDSLGTLYRRWARIAFGNYQMLWRYRSAVRHDRLALPLARKALKTLGPVLLFSLALSAVWTAGTWRGPWAALICAGAGVLGAALPFALQGTALGRVRLLRGMRYGLAAQLAYFEGTFRFITRRRDGLWRRPVTSLAAQWPKPPLSVRAAKRTFDLTAASVGLLVTAPVIAVIAVAIKLDSRGTVFYRQDRTRWGPDGTPMTFYMLKFRTMCQAAEAQSGPVWAAKDDPRVTRLGRFLRKHRLDELPQLFNILIGEMTLVGPRPERPSIVATLSAQVPGYGERLAAVRPGITGWAQVQCGYDTTFDGVGDKVLHDLAYVAHLYRLSTYLRMELRVLLRTVSVVWYGKGAQ
ncbi:MAG: sugar transferase [Deltaproteobacteria bacterium]|nr:sugar transferase [Deltaproteobacteria bacterium]MCB9788871.1 sugar transferase [Deltaproteobacteria bacterium]